MNKKTESLHDKIYYIADYRLNPKTGDPLSESRMFKETDVLEKIKEIEVYFCEENQYNQFGKLSCKESRLKKDIKKYGLCNHCEKFDELFGMKRR